MREKVQEELQQIEQQDVIKDVTRNSTPWLRLLVAVNKDEDNVRICIDMRCGNQAIQQNQ